MSKMVDLELELTPGEEAAITQASRIYFAINPLTKEHKKFLQPWYRFKRASCSWTTEGQVAMWIGTVLEEECKRLVEDAE